MEKSHRAQKGHLPYRNEEEIARVLELLDQLKNEREVKEKEQVPDSSVSTTNHQKK